MDVMGLAFDFVTSALLGVFALFSKVVEFLNLRVFFGTLIFIYSVYRFIIVPFLSGKIGFGKGKSADSHREQKHSEKGEIKNV